MLLQIEKRQMEPDITVLAFAGRITLGRESQQIESMVNELLAQNTRKLVFDMSAVDYIDSAGLGILTYCFGVMKQAGGAFRVAAPNGKVRQLIRFTHLDALLPVYATLEDATKDFGN